MIEAGGRVAVVTGAARGIGQAIALRLAKSDEAAMISGQTLRIDGGLVTL
jgi:NADP-dependent 3-hydroxy acid dehydrogenase YdfG